MNRFIVLPAILMVLCMSSATFAANRPADPALHGDPQLMRTEGHALARKGEKKVATAEARLKDGQELTREGELLIKEGNAGIARGHDNYAKFYRTTGVSDEPELVIKEARRLLKIGEDWEDALDDLRKGEKLLKKGNKKINKERKKLREGNALIEKGNTMIRNSELISRGEPILVPST